MANRDALIKGFLRRNAQAKGKISVPKGRRKPPTRITEDDPRWNPATMGNKRWGPGYRGALNYDKGPGRPS